MTDTTTLREDILLRMYAVLKTVEGFRAVERNLDEFPEGARPMAVLLDGDREAVPELQRTWVRGKVPIVTNMLPLVCVSVSNTPDRVGGDVNLLEMRVIDAILSDAALNGVYGDPQNPGLVTKNGGVYWERTAWRLNHSLAMDCDAQIEFRVRFPMFIRS